MNQDQAIKRCEEAMLRDPRSAPYGYFSGGSFVLDSTRVFMWFETVDELINHIIECDTLVHGLNESEAEAFGSQARSIFGERLELTDEHLTDLNQLAKSFLCIEWWGTFDELTHGDSNLAKDMRSSLRENESDLNIMVEEMDEFVNLAQNYGF